MEALLHYCWKHRIYPVFPLRTTDGQDVEVINPGLLNSNAGPDFFNAKVKIGGELWVGNVEMHINPQDWYAHGHDKDHAYDSVILHVVAVPPTEGKAWQGAKTSDGRVLPEVVVPIPDYISANYKELLEVDSYPPCYKVIPRIPAVKVHSWMAALETERLEEKTSAIGERVKLLDDDWEHAYFVTLARSFGMGQNSDVLEQWARELPMNAVAHHRDDILQVEAFFFGEAGLLNVAAVPERMKLETAADEYFQRLQMEYDYLASKFRLTASPSALPRREGTPCGQRARAWKFMRMRPQNFPHIRVAQLARLYSEGRTSLQQLLACKTVKDLQKLLKCGVSAYWEDHYTFGHESAHNTKQLSRSSIESIMINTAIPMMFCYGRYMAKEELCERAFELLEALTAENNNIVRMWQDVGLGVRTAGDSQALIQLKKKYCDRRDCLRCRFGYEYLKEEKWRLSEGE